LNPGKIITVVVGMAVLGGLAYHQSGLNQFGPGEESILAGTAIDAEAEDVAPDRDSPPDKTSNDTGCDSTALAREQASEEDCDLIRASDKPLHAVTR